MSKYIDAEKLKERVTRLIASARKNDWPIAEDYLRRVIDIIDSLQQEQPMPDSTKLIELWHEDKEMLKEKDFRDDPWRLAYNAFMCGFGRGIAVNKQEQPESDLEKELRSYNVPFNDGGWERLTYNTLKGIARHFFELGRNARKSVWHNVTEETPTKYGSKVIVACRNKNKEDGIWLYDLIQCWEGEWEPRVNWETPVKWAYVKDLDSAKKEESE